jgi:DNA-binding beta-propeller fold protein YncE
VARAAASAATIILIGIAATPQRVAADAPDLLLRVPEGQIEPGGGAGQLDNPRAVAGNSTTGHVYITEAENARVSQYTAWGLFVRAWGWDVAPEGASGDTASDQFETCGPAQPEGTPPAGLCKAGTEGDGAGQFSRPNGIAIDPSGAVYVLDRANLRVQKFSSTGQFLLMFGGDVNRTKVDVAAPPEQRNLCPVDPGDVCQTGTTGSGQGHFAGTVGNYIAYNPALNAIAVGDRDRIQIFNLDGTFKEEIRFEGELALFDEEGVSALDVDSAGNFYIVVSGFPDIYKLSPSGEPLAPGKAGESSFEVPRPRGLAVDDAGNVYAIESAESVSDPGGRYVLGFDSAGNLINGMRPADEFAKPETDAFPEFQTAFNGDLVGIATNSCSGSAGPNIYAVRFNVGSSQSRRSYVSVYGPPPVGCEPPPARAPSIEDQFATAAGTDSATVRALINPRFWADTTYYVQYGTGKCSEGGCDRTHPLPPGSALTDKVVNVGLATVGVLLQGLAPATEYHYRFVAQSSGGGPAVGPERTFKTFMRPDPVDSCPVIEVFRSGPSARLPDCRAYEMVSPLDKGTGEVGLALKEEERNQSALSGDAFTFSSITAFADPMAAPYVSQYLTKRSSDGWSTESMMAPRTTPPLSVTASGKRNEFKAFSSDLCHAWFLHNSSATLTPDAVSGYANLYRRNNCAAPPSFAALTTVKPPKRPPGEYFPLVHGFSDDGTRVIFTAEDKLHPDAPQLALKELRLYESTPAGLRYVCYLPNGNPSPQACSAGTAAGLSGGIDSNVHNAISADGSHIFWTAFSGELPLKFSHPGAIYVRIDAKETVAVSKSVTSDPAIFWTAADDGSKAIFRVVEGSLKDNLYEFDVARKTPRLIAEGVEGPLGASEDASQIYFASRKALAPGGTEGGHNLYHYVADPGGGGGAYTFVMALTDDDIAVLPGRPVPIEDLAIHRAATVSADGRFAVFMSVATPTGYDNLDATSGEPASEVYRYDGMKSELLCVSCNPTGVRPAGVNVTGTVRPFWVAARIQAGEAFLHAPRVLSSDGSRVFFESHEALVPRDTNGRWDVYQWEQPGKGTCSEDDATFHEANGGCVDLISSGESAADSRFLDADPSGDNVFIGTQSSLVGADYGLNDVYVARVGGGFPEPTAPVECEGEACPTPRAAPPEVTPPSATVKPSNPRRPCPKGKRRVKRKGKVRCVKPNKAARHKRGNRKREGRR